MRAHTLPSVLRFSAVLCAVYGAVDELHQSFVPGRDRSAGDWLADVLGAGTTAGFKVAGRHH